MTGATKRILPQEFLDRLKKLVPDRAFDQILSAFSVPRPTTFRINRLKSESAEVLSDLRQSGFVAEGVPWYRDAYILRTGDLRSLTETDAYRNGKLYVQSLSSMLPPLILAPTPGERVLDITAAPGSKTTQMAAMMGNIGEIIANDLSRVRNYRLAANLALQGANIAQVRQQDARAVWQTYPEYFDKVLADVPCSMEGRFNTGEPKSYEDWSPKKVKELSHLQQWILRSAVSSAKPGGTIVYSTCTLSPEENEAVVDWVLKKEKGKIELEEIAVPGCTFDHSVHSWGTKTYNEAVGLTARIYPTGLMEGFFIAKLKKLERSIPGDFTAAHAV